MELKGFDAGQIAKLDEMYKWYQKQVPGGNIPSRDTGDDFPQTTESYMALTPANGISALTSAGTGSNPNGSQDMPGSAACQLYQVVNGRMVLVSIKEITVYNASGAQIPGFSWTPITRDKFGIWWSLYAPGSCYMALPVFQITGLARAGTGSADGLGDIPGNGNCTIYQFNGSSMQPSSIGNVLVYNMGEPVIVKNWVLVNRDVFGTFWVDPAFGAARALWDVRSFLGTSRNYIPQGGTGQVSRGTKPDATVSAAFGAIQHGVGVYVSWDWANGFWIGIQIGCPVGTGT